MIHSASPGPSESVVDATFIELVERLTHQLQSGEPLDMETLAREHPKYASRLRRLLPAIQAAAELGVANAISTTTQSVLPRADGDFRCLGEFRLIREIGRGGMGVVYEAEQITLGRRVALKVMPFAALLDSRQLERFRIEAKAAATLHHTNIVPLYSVGCDRGVHYYAMQYIEGDSLAAILRKLREMQSTTKQVSSRSPSEMTEGNEPPEEHPAQTVDTALTNALSTEYSNDRMHYLERVVRFASTACDALEHAHFHGIIHRDIKPANLLLDVDGHLWVTDFGLARLEQDVSMTRTGDVMGTLRYMSPEQARGDRHLVDPRADIYSLGATLYELLTLQPVFASTDHAQLLKQIADEEPRSLRTLDRRIPEDLETIVLKSLQKCPEDRYPSAQAMADDLQRFLEQKPILAKLPTRFVRAIRWSRRNHSLVLATSVFLFVGILGLSVAMALLVRSYGQQVALRQATETALHQRDEALETAVQSIDDMYFDVAEKLLVTLPAQTSRRREFLGKALHAYENVLQQNPTDTRLRYSIARVSLALAKLESSGVGPNDRKPWFDRSFDLLTQLVAEHPDVEDYRASLAEAWMFYGWLTCAGDIDRLEPVLMTAVRLEEEDVRRHPESRSAVMRLSVIKRNLATECYVASGRYQEGTALLTEALALRERAAMAIDGSQPDEGAQMLKLLIGRARYLQNRSCLTEYRSCLENIYSRLKQVSESVIENSRRSGFGSYFDAGNHLPYLSSLARLELDEGSLSAAMELVDLGVQDSRRLLSDNPDVHFYRRQYGLYLALRGEILWRLGRLDDAKTEMAEAITRLDDISTISDVCRILVVCPFPDLQDPERSLSYWTTYLTGNRRVDDSVADVLAEYRLGEFGTSLKKIDHYRAAVSESEEPAMSFLRAACLFRLGRKDQAAAAYSAAQDAYAVRPAFEGCDLICHEVMQLFERESVTMGGVAK